MENKKNAIIIAVVIAVILAAVVVFVVVFKGNTKKTTTSQDSETQVSEEQETKPASESAVAETVSPAATVTPKPTKKPVKYPVNVTKDTKADVMKLMKRFEAYICLTQESDTDVPWNSNTRTMAAIYQLNYVTNEVKYDSDFAKAKAKAKEELADTWTDPVTFMMTPSIDFYGTLYSNNDGKLSYNGGDWGDVKFKSKVKKVVLKKNGTYFVKYGTAPVSATDKGTSKAKLKYYMLVLVKSDKKYGFTLKSIKTYSARDAKRFR